MGSGWLGTPLASYLVALGHAVKLSTTTVQRLPELVATGASGHVVDIARIDNDMHDFLQADVLIINITCKDVDAFECLMPVLQHSVVTKVLFVSSTSVYRNCNKVVTESDGEELPQSLLYQIENLLRQAAGFDTTVLRFAGLVGRRRHPGRFFHSGKQVRYPDAPVNLIHRDDCIEIIRRIIERGVWGEVFSGCSDTHPLKREFYSQAASSIDAPQPVFAESEQLAFKIISNDKIKSSLQLLLKYPDMMQMLNRPEAFEDV